MTPLSQILRPWRAFGVLGSGYVSQGFIRANYWLEPNLEKMNLSVLDYSQVCIKK
jgi:hypothetical protein